MTFLKTVLIASLFSLLFSGCEGRIALPNWLTAKHADHDINSKSIKTL